MFNELVKNVMSLGIITEDDVKRLTSVELMLLIIERTNGLLSYLNSYVDSNEARITALDEKYKQITDEIKKLIIDNETYFNEIISENLENLAISQLNEWVSDGTLETLINQTALKNINDHITDITTINVMDYGLKGDGTTEDLTQLKELLSTKLVNKTILFPANKVIKINEPIKLLAEKCTIRMEGEIIADACDGVLLDDVMDCTITINSIKTPITYNPWYDYNNGKNVIDYSRFTNYGLRLNNARTNKITINRIHGFKYGLYFAPSTFSLNGTIMEAGTQYNEVTFNQVEACTYPICFERLANLSWANSNFIRGGMTSGDIAIKFVASTFRGDPYNQNVFTNIGCEYLKGGGFLLEEGKENIFYDFRHDKVDNFYIKTLTPCNNNTFKTNYSGFIDGCALHGTNDVIEMPSYKYTDTKSMISNKTTALSGYNTQYNTSNYFYKGLTRKTTECLAVDGDVPLTSYYKMVNDFNNKPRIISPFPYFRPISSGSFTITYKNMTNVFYLKTIDSDVIIKFDETAENVHYGFEYTFMTTGDFKHIPIFMDSKGVTIPSLVNKITQPDTLYKIIFIGDGYAVFKVGERL